MDHRSPSVFWPIAFFLLLAVTVPLGMTAMADKRAVDPDKLLNASVSIRTISHVTIDQFGDSVWSAGSGSGFLVSKEGCEIWTNHHVIEDAAIVEVFPRGAKVSTGLRATVVNSTPRADVAILRVEQCDDIETVALGDSDLVRPGDESYAVGNPLGINPDSISRGIISHVERYVNGTIPHLQTDAAISPGNSGGALFDSRGRVVGINTAVAANRKGMGVGIGYAVPINLVRKTIASLRNGPPSWGDAGLSGKLSSLTSEEAEVFRVPHGYQAVTVSSSPQQGASAGKLFERDVIYRINGVTLNSVVHALRIISEQKPGDLVEFDIVRGGQMKTVALSLTEGWEAKPAPVPGKYDGYLGLSLEMWHDRDEDVGQIKTPVIARVQSLGPAHRGHISSSQRSARMRGPFMVPYQLDVKTITGVVFRGEYHEVKDTAAIDSFAREAFEAEEPLLLEIELWARANPQQGHSPLERLSSAFYRVVPTAGPADDTEQVAELSAEIVAF
ncbi:MAG: trypsin-like peptidase domain-containing protein [Gammaproteobacteria bacterium]|nr:trypsin-like peptidase domain-containing protein [Gammaproteobacteria bacterium]